MMACYQTSYSPLGLPPSSEKTFENESARKGIKSYFNTNKFSTYNEAYFFFLSSATSIAVICFAIQQVAGRSTTYGDLELYEAVFED